MFHPPLTYWTKHSSPKRSLTDSDCPDWWMLCMESDWFSWCCPQHQFLSEALQWRAQTDPDHVLYVLLNAKVEHTSTHTDTHAHSLICN